MELIVYSNFSKKKNSTKQPTGGTTYDVKLKAPTSVLNPVFLLDGINLNANYCKWNNRYYFIDDIVFINNNMYELHCTVDVLASWKTVIGDSTQYVVRSSNEYDGFIMDTFYPATTETVYSFASHSPGLGWTNSLGSGYYVIGIQNTDNNASQHGAVSYYVMTPAEYNNFKNHMINFIWGSESTFDDTITKAIIKPEQYVVSAKWFPFSPPMGAEISNIRFGAWNLSGLSAHYLASDPVVRIAKTIDLPKHPQAAERGEYLNMAPYSYYKLFFPVFGSINLPSEDIANGSGVSISMYIDCITGLATILVYGSDSTTATRRTSLLEASVGIDITLSSTSSNLMNLGQSITGGVVGAALSLAGENVIGAVSSAITGIGNAINSIAPSSNNSGSPGNMSKLVASGDQIYIVCTFMKIVDEDNDGKGRPLCKEKVLNTIPGYIQCSDVHLDIAATPTEKDMINSYLISGFFYE